MLREFVSNKLIQSKHIYKFESNLDISRSKINLSRKIQLNKTNLIFSKN